MTLSEVPLPTEPIYHDPHYSRRYRRPNSPTKGVRPMELERNWSTCNERHRSWRKSSTRREGACPDGQMAVPRIPLRLGQLLQKQAGQARHALLGHCRVSLWSAPAAFFFLLTPLQMVRRPYGHATGQVLHHVPFLGISVLPWFNPHHFAKPIRCTGL